METEPKTQTEIIYRSKLPDIEIPKHLPLHAYCLERVERVSSRPCLINGTTGDILTYADLDHATRRFAAGLHRIGVGKGHVIMLLLPNTPEFIIAFLGASRVGAATTAANPFHTASEIAKHAEAAGAKLLVAHSSSFEKVKDLNNRLKIACIDEPPPNSGWMRFAELADSDEREAPEVEISGDDVVALPFSSGTTGLPKGVMLTHKGKVTSIAQQVDGENPNLDFSCEDVMLCVLPLFHIYSLNITLCGLRVGAGIMIMERFETRRLLELIEKYRVTVAPMVPPIVLTIARSPEVEKYDLSSVRIVKSGAAPLGKELEASIKAKFPNAKFGQGYGMTEAGPVLAMSLGFAKEPFEVKSGACGSVIRNAEMKIVDPDTGVSLPRNQPGEICIRGDQIMKGYLKDPEATERTIDKGGWLHTGDVGYMDDDDELFIVDRLKELIKYKGFQVAPAELEAMLINHPQISDAAVVAKKDEEAGEIPVAFVVRSKNSLLTQNEVKQYISEQVVFYKRLKEVFFVEVIPKAPSGKILRKDLRARLASDDIPS